ncbi:helix-turn-helix transcriptional regulator [Streptomyces sp. NPDC059564]|uniref:helix-turn-helix transcriptional regulator n=1 Tax=Streptomyces sp. NPDC059564 TaxID=3346865 RepID=UPI0036B99557
MRLRDVALACALTERTVQTIVADLESDGYLQRVRDGRRNRYEISAGAVFKHPAEAGVQVAGLLALLTGVPAADPPVAVTENTAPDEDLAADVPAGAAPDPAVEHETAPDLSAYAAPDVAPDPGVAGGDGGGFPVGAS